MNNTAKNRFITALYPLPMRLREPLINLKTEVMNRVEEIRLRAGKPLMLTVSGAPMWVVSGGGVSYIPQSPLYVSAEDIKETFFNLCNHSVYSHMEEINQGFIMMKGSHRAGICGTKIPDGMRDISSINIRVAREVFGAADQILDRIGDKGLLIAGPPGSGKTTILRDTIRQLSKNRRKRIAVIDSRGEIAAMESSVPQNDIGDNTDVLTGASKREGIEMAVRTMGPEIVAFDEIGSLDEVAEVVKSLSSGVRVLTTAHCGTREELLSRGVTKKLIESGVISCVALLSSPGGSIEFIETEQFICES